MAVPLARLFQLSTTACLMLAVLCLASVEAEGLRWFYGLMVLAIAVAGLPQRRWIMPGLAANVAALLILGGWLAWAVGSVRDEFGRDAPVFDYVRWMLLHVGPLLCLLQLAKLFRPRQASDHWLLHGVALMEVTLACILALVQRQDRTNLFFVAALLAYAFAAVWSLLLFHLHRESSSGGADGAASSALNEETPAGAPMSSRSLGFRWGLGAGLGWFSFALIAGLALFLLVPRPQSDAGNSWLTGGPLRSQVGFRPGIDLNRDAWPELSQEVVGTVTAYTQSDNQMNLGTLPRWRGVTCTRYERGQWRPLDVGDPSPWEFRDPLKLEAKHLRLVFEVNPGLLQSLSSDWQASNEAAARLPLPLFDASPARRSGAWLFCDQPGVTLDYRRIETALLADVQNRAASIRYEQLLTGERARDVDLRRWVELRPPDMRRPFRVESYIAELQTLPSELAGREKILPIARAALAKRGLSGAPSPLDTAERVREKARVLEAYLGNNAAEFAYSLGRRRVDASLDPTVDFLCNPVKTAEGTTVRAGRCEHYASALALLLRSQKIPARVVVGFYGAQWNESFRRHEIRQDHAHAWVEVLVGNREADDFIYEGKWETYDPTPGAGETARQDLSRSLLEGVSDGVRYLWESFVLDYTGSLKPARLWERTANAFEMIWLGLSDAFTGWRGITLLATLVGGVGTLILGRWRRRRRRWAKALQVPFLPLYERLLRMLAQLSLWRTPTQTPEEFSLSAARVIAARIGPSPLANLPARMTACYYELRYGGRTLEEEHESALAAELDALQQALRHPPPVALAGA
jgi:transglutaminase-like putative cysteine protease